MQLNTPKPDMKMTSVSSEHNKIHKHGTVNKKVEKVIKLFWTMVRRTKTETKIQLTNDLVYVVVGQTAGSLHGLSGQAQWRERTNNPTARPLTTGWAEWPGVLHEGRGVGSGRAPMLTCDECSSHIDAEWHGSKPRIGHLWRHQKHELTWSLKSTLFF